MSAYWKAYYIFSFPYLPKKQTNKNISLATQIRWRKSGVFVSTSGLFWCSSPTETHSVRAKNTQFISRDCCRPQTTDIFVPLLHLVGFAEVKVPKVGVKHVKCYLPYLLGHWIFMGLDTGAAQTTSSSLRSHQTRLICRHAAPKKLIHLLVTSPFVF